MANSYHPTARMIRTLFTENGFAEPVPVEELRTGGFVFTREASDGRLQTAYVFSWSNFRIAAERGKLPCTLWIRVFFQTDRPVEEAIRNAQNGMDLGVHFSPGQWPEIREIVSTKIVPLFDLETEKALIAAGELSELST